MATTAEVLAHPELDESVLHDWERRRLAAVRVPARRDDVVAARLLLRLCAARATGEPPGRHALVQFCPDCRRAGHGRPALRNRPDIGVSMSHADGLVAAAAGPGAVGIDVEPAGRRPRAAAVLRRMLPEAADGDPLAAWVRREARLKAGRPDGPVRVWTDAGRDATAAVACDGPVRCLPDFTAPVGRQ
ncbi:4-phosphopantetheinyl transferase [Streptomyces sp. NPDC048182]|uniref:4-phosphopantetheinyl transferase n=1 Tax=Streptomyces sp. NPDC048182 TaxID=3365507 RepID=UPI00371A9261